MERTGRPRDPQIDRAVLDATIDELSQVGYARLTLEAVARRAGTTKPSIYRRWRSRPELVLGALTGRLGALPAPDSGCVVCDLADGVGMWLAVYRRMPPGAFGALFADCVGRPGLREAFMSRLFKPPRQAVGELVDRAKARGDLWGDLDRELAVEMLGALVHYRSLFGHAETDGEAVEAAVVALLRGFAADYGELAGRKSDHEHGLG